MPDHDYPADASALVMLHSERPAPLSAGALRITHEPQLIDREKWTRFVDTHPRGTPFQRPEMFDVYAATRRNRPVLTALIDNTGMPAGVLLGFEQRSWSGLVGSLTSRVVVWGGPLVTNPPGDLVARLLKAHNELLLGRSVFTQFRHLWDLSAMRETFVNAGYAHEDHLDVLVDIDPDLDVMWKRMKHMRRKNIKRAEREGVQFREIDTMADIQLTHRYIRDLYSRIKLPLPHPTYFEAIAAILRPAGLARYFGTYHRDRLIAARIVLTHRHWMYDFWAGADEQHSRLEGATALLWKILCWGAQRGYRVFDFGGAGKPDVPYGVRDFKLAYGGNLVCFGRDTRIHRPWVYRAGVAAIELLRTTARTRRATAE